MPVALGLDARLGLAHEALRDIAGEAAALGFASIWTPSFGYDPLQMCVAWYAATGLPTGVSVLPVTYADPGAIAFAARTAYEATDGTFTLGIGSGGLREGALDAVRATVRALRADAPGVPVHVAALGPRMLRLAGAEADGVALNWCTPEHVTWSRSRSGADVPHVSYVRVCVDDDVAAARRTLGRQVVAYSIGSPSYRAHWARMGFEAELAALEGVRAARGDDAAAGAVPERMLAATAYAGPAEGARDAVAQLGRGLDLVIVRPLLVTPGDVDALLGALHATAPR